VSRDPHLLLQDIVESGEAIQGYIAGLDFDRFAADQLRMDGVVRRFEIIGEAVKKLPAVLTDAEPAIPWRAIAGFRDVLAHAYFDTDASIVWNSATEHLPALLAACRRLDLSAPRSEDEGENGDQKSVSP
jgi:uncharacterized protein with HEPN domain